MHAPPALPGIVTPAPIQTPLGCLHYGGVLRGVQGTGLNGFRTYGLYAAVIVTGTGGRYRDARGLDRRLTPGDLIMVFPELPHQYGPEAGDDWDECFLSFSGAAFDAWRGQGLDPAHPVWTVGQPAHWIRAFANVLSGELSQLEDACRRVGQIHAWIAHWLSLRLPTDQSPRWLGAARHALAAGADGPSIAKTARTAGLSPDGFRRAFRQATGETPAAFRRRQRVAQAALLLRRNDLTLQQIASALGFSDAFHLSKVFRRIQGQSPSQYRLQFHA